MKGKILKVWKNKKTRDEFLRLLGIGTSLSQDEDEMYVDWAMTPPNQDYLPLASTRVSYRKRKITGCGNNHSNYW